MVELTDDEIRRRGLEALRRELGIVGMIRFLRFYDKGKGDYTAERHEWLDQMTPEEVYARIEATQQKAELTPTLPPK